MNAEQPGGRAGRELSQYEVYLAERLELIRGAAAGSHAFDRTLTTLSAGAIAFTLTYAQVWLQRPEASTRIWLLLASWGCFLASLIVILASYLASQKAHERQVEIVEHLFVREDCEQEDSPDSQRNPWRTATKALNLTCFGFFIAGVMAFSVFVISNMQSTGG